MDIGGAVTVGAGYVWVMLWVCVGWIGKVIVAMGPVGFGSVVWIGAGRKNNHKRKGY